VAAEEGEEEEDTGGIERGEGRAVAVPTGGEADIDELE